ncbi:3-alpha,7-alpha,12-alpha-trihydroxy-5-beta-cholest-24-enoyl-CoA hydratase [Lentzea sp. NBRC 105346]|uniref:MaoC/PaaZ C-terminal domain-containing protein n=1 Tax=Lentzea sp. NBRC 105346 TaxID=3032205 RepID=UPI0024A3926F|nr:MaoC/PaaZ C-terminal domain-containing protein [Lentzea sp. NBRC 105346]GLZ32377.1 3-alpha,7-alpha,12-alpha-trihydroxy-5-beta-cholest-24-enoyl-CoA hydratase [Lentzea sp. NBRC 105346]
MLDHSILGVVEVREQSWTLDDASVYEAAVGGPSPAFPITLAQHGGPQLGLTGADMTQVLHATQTLVVEQPLPAEGTMTVTKTVTDIFDKGSGALVVSTWETPYFSTRSSCFVKGEGGFGGPRGSTPELEVPQRAPDRTWTYQTTEDQALRYRETGDVNPMHWDPEFAAKAGFDRPILHGLCTLGIALAGMKASMIDCRFTAPVYPGELLTVEHWDGGEFRVRTDRVVLVGQARDHLGAHA